MATVVTVKEHVYQILRERMISGTYRSGQRISDDELAKEFEVSRSPVREAIGQLVNDGLVVYRPRRGMFVKTFDRRDVGDLYGVRIALEGYVAAQAAQRATKKDLAKIDQTKSLMLKTVRECRKQPKKTAGRGLVNRFLKHDEDFHLQIAIAAGNKRILETIQDCKVLIKIFLYAS